MFFSKVFLLSALRSLGEVGSSARAKFGYIIYLYLFIYNINDTNKSV